MISNGDFFALIYLKYIHNFTNIFHGFNLIFNILFLNKIIVSLRSLYDWFIFGINNWFIFFLNKIIFCFSSLRSLYDWFILRINDLFILKNHDWVVLKIHDWVILFKIHDWFMLLIYVNDFILHQDL